MTSKNKKSTALGYNAPEVNVVEMLPEGVLAASVDMSAPSIDDMPEWSGWEE
jgi:hypothetical protein